MDGVGRISLEVGRIVGKVGRIHTKVGRKSKFIRFRPNSIKNRRPP